MVYDLGKIIKKLNQLIKFLIKNDCCCLVKYTRISDAKLQEKKSKLNYLEHFSTNGFLINPTTFPIFINPFFNFAKLH